MDFRHQISLAGEFSGVGCNALLLVVSGDVATTQLDPVLAALVAEAIEGGDFTIKAGQTLYLHRPAGIQASRVVLAAAGATTVKAFRAAVVSGTNLLKSSGATDLAIGIAGNGPVTAAHAEAAVTAVQECVYLYRHTKPSAAPVSKLDKVTLLCAKTDAKAVQQGIERGEAIAAGVHLARECANRPANYCTPTYLAEQAKKLGKAHDLKVEVLDRKDCEKLGMGSFLAVAQGSEEPLRFIVARYEGAGKSTPPVVLVGKGITFDTGGISLKPGAEMDEMKYDMGGAASVLGTLRAIVELKPKLNLVCIIPSCDNMPSGSAVKPGDVVTSMSGQTIEILNTDAEGRLILCDALTYAERFKPAVVVDVATLTGACVVALGHHHSGLFTADDEIAAQMLAASTAAIDPCWRMPLDEEYDTGLKSNFADMANIAGRPGGCDHRGHVPAPLHRQIPLGPPRHRRHRLEVGSGQGRHRKAGAVADAFRAGAGRMMQAPMKLPGTSRETTGVFPR